MNSLYRLTNNLLYHLSHRLFGFNRISPIFIINYEKQNKNKSLIDEIMTNGLVFATQKKRRTVESKVQRRFGVQRFADDCSLIRPKNNITICDNCGDYHQMYTICGNCYKTVKRESNLIIEKIREKFNYNQIIDKEIDIKYKNDDPIDTDLNGKHIVEIDRQRPEWFAKNLLSKSVDNKWIEKNPIIREEDPKVIKDN